MRGGVGSEKGVGRERRRAPIFVAVAVLAALLVGLTVFYWSTISAQARAVAVLSSVTDAPVLAPAVAGLTGEPVLKDGTVAGVPTLVARPAGEGPWPALVFGNGAVPPGSREPTVRRLAEGLARAGYVVYVPDVPGLRSGEISPETASATVSVARAVADHPDARDGRVGFVGVSVGASLTLLAARDADLRDRVSVVAAVAPYADLEDVLRLATTDTHRDGGRVLRYETPNYLRLIAARSLVSLLPSGEDREVLRRLLPRLENFYVLEDQSRDPLADLRAFLAASGEDIGPETRAVVELLINTDPERFDALYADLPARTRERVEDLSPVNGIERLAAPVEIATAPRDTYFPLAEQEELARKSPRVRLTVTPALDHALPALSLEDLPAFLKLNAWTVRSLREARTREAQSLFRASWSRSKKPSRSSSRATSAFGGLPDTP